MSASILTLPQAVFFDFDGVILESADVKTEAFLVLFDQYPEHREAIRHYHIQNMGVSRFIKFEWICKNLLGLPYDDTMADELGVKFSNIVLQKVLEAPFVPGALELIQKLNPHVPCFIASGTPEVELQAIVRHRNLTQYFREVCGTPRTKTQIANELVARYNLVTSQCWFIGDALTDQQAAKETGMHFIARRTADLNHYWVNQTNIMQVDTLQEITTSIKWA